MAKASLTMVEVTQPMNFSYDSLMVSRRMKDVASLQI